MNAKGIAIREKIITLADNLFYKNGFSNTSFSDISNAVGISRGNFYYHFKTKDDILAAVIDQRKAVIKNMLQKWNENASTPEERLGKFVDMLREEHNEITEHGCPIGSTCNELSKLGNVNYSRATGMIELFRQWLAEQFLAMDFDQSKADQLAMHLIGRTQGITVIANAYTDCAYLLREVEQLKEWIQSLS